MTTNPPFTAGVGGVFRGVLTSIGRSADENRFKIAGLLAFLAPICAYLNDLKRRYDRIALRAAEGRMKRRPAGRLRRAGSDPGAVRGPREPTGVPRGFGWIIEVAAWHVRGWDRILVEVLETDEEARRVAAASPTARRILRTLLRALGAKTLPEVVREPARPRTPRSKAAARARAKRLLPPTSGSPPPAARPYAAPRPVSAVHATMVRVLAELRAIRRPPELIPTLLQDIHGRITVLPPPGWGGTPPRRPA